MHQPDRRARASPHQRPDLIGPAQEARRTSAREIAAMTADARRMAQLSAIFSNPVRSLMLLLLVNHPTLSVGALAILAGASVSLVSHHLALMRIEGLIVMSRHGRMRKVQLASPRQRLAIEFLRDAGMLSRDGVNEPAPAPHSHDPGARHRRRITCPYT